MDYAYLERINRDRIKGLERIAESIYKYYWMVCKQPLMHKNKIKGCYDNLSPEWIFNTAYIDHERQYACLDFIMQLFSKAKEDRLFTKSEYPYNFKEEINLYDMGFYRGYTDLEDKFRSNQAYYHEEVVAKIEKFPPFLSLRPYSIDNNGLITLDLSALRYFGEVIGGNFCAWKIVLESPAKFEPDFKKLLLTEEQTTLGSKMTTQKNSPFLQSISLVGKQTNVIKDEIDLSKILVYIKPGPNEVIRNTVKDILLELQNLRLLIEFNDYDFTTVATIIYNAGYVKNIQTFIGWLRVFSNACNRKLPTYRPNQVIKNIDEIKGKTTLFNEMYIVAKK